MTLSKQEVEFLHDLLRCIETLDAECRGLFREKYSPEKEEELWSRVKDEYPHLKKEEFLLYDVMRAEHDILITERSLATKEDIVKYIVEFTDSFIPFLEEGFYLNAEWGTSQTFGTTVQFSVSEKKEPPRYNKELENFPSLAQNVGIAYQEENDFKEDIWCEYEDKLYIHKTNDLKGWTEFSALEDTRKLIHETIGDIRMVFYVD